MSEIPTAPSRGESAPSGTVSLARRRFILLSAVAGMAAMASPYVVPRLLRRFDLTPDLYRDRGRRPIGRYYVDPTMGEREGRLILAPEIGVEAAHDKFSLHAVREFNL